jgi:uncharacterized membrane protein YjfL (UPF0719 family)
MDLHVPQYLLMDLAVTAAFGVLAVVLITFGYKVFDRLTPKLHFDENLSKGNIAAAIVIGSFILGICYVVAHVVSGVLGGS